MDYIFKSEGLSKKYGKFQALSSVNMEIPKGSIYGFVGKNGAEKTTLIRLLCGLQFPTEGSYEIMGVNRCINTNRFCKVIIKKRLQVFLLIDALSLYRNH
jgi:ABC-2 type transport system ATP-binding protein